MKSGRRIATTVCAFAILIPFFFSFINFSAAIVNEQHKVMQLYDNLDINVTESTTNVMNHVRVLSSFQSRVPGYPGHQDAAAYITEKFTEYGLEPGGEEGYSQYFNLSIPIDLGTEVKMLPDGPTFHGHALWPNLVQTCKTPEEGLDGKLIYVGTGTLKELAAKKIEGNIALMDFNSGRNWLNLVRLGAKGVIFIGPEYTTRIEAESKFLLTPLYFPRIYISKDVGNTLRALADNEKTIRITSNMVWKQVRDENIIGFIPGTTYPNDTIIFAAHYDDWSIVPSLAPGADDAAGISALLELARLMKQNPPKRTVLFVAVSGHWEAIAGAREFAENHFFTQEVQSGQLRPWLFLGYDLSTDSNRIGYFALGGGTYAGVTGGSLIEQRYIPLYGLFRSTYLPALKQKGYNTDLLTSGQTDDFPIPISHIYDSEAAIMTGIWGFTLRTTYSLRIDWSTPFSTFEIVNPNNLMPQLTFALYISFFIANQDDFGTRWQRPLRGSGPQSGIADERAGSGVVFGDVVVYNRKEGFYNSTLLLRNEYTILVVATNGYSRLDPFSQVIVMADKNGKYTISGIMGWRCAGLSRIPEFGASSTTHVAGGRANRLDISAYVLDNTRGAMIYAKDWGDYGDKIYPSFDIYGGTRWWIQFPTFQRIVVFRCGTLVLTDVVDPTTVKPPEFNINTRDAPEEFQISMEVRDLAGHTSLDTYGMVTPSYTHEDLALVFIPTEWVTAPVEIILRYGRQYALRGLLMNSTEKHREGVGYVVQTGEQEIITFTSLHVARSLFYLNERRRDDLHRFNIWVPAGEEQHRSALQKLSEAELSLNRRDYQGAYSNSLLAWGYEVMPYSSIFDTIQQVLTTSVFFSLLLIPFSFMLEKIAFNREGKLRVALISAIFVITYFIFSMLNPSTIIATNSIMVMLGFVVMILTFFTFYILTSSFVGALRMVRAKTMGPHFVTGKIGSVFTTSWSVGIGNMRKRKNRTFLFLITLILTFAGLVSLTSITALSVTQVSTKTGTAPYDGMLIQLWHGGYLSRIPNQLLGILENELKNATIYPRSYIFFPLTPTIGFPHTWLVGKDGKLLVRAAEGLTPQEADLTNIDKLILPGGQWFQKDDIYAAVISEYASNITGIGVGDEIDLMGLKLQVRGIISDETDGLRDMGDLALSPQAVPPPIGERAAANIQIIPFSETILIPYKLAEKLDGKIYSVAVKSENRTQILNLAKALNSMSSQEYSIIASFQGEIYYFGYARGLLVRGSSLFLVPMLISILMVFNLMLGLIYERKREISVLSLVGLAPSEISAMFIAESTEYALLSVVMGYLVGITMAKVLLGLNVIPLEFFPQFTSISMLITMVAFIVIVMSGAIYPSLIAGRLVSPSQRRRWEISEPVGDMWEINMPFILEQSEMEGFLLYLGEYLRYNPDENFEIEDLSYGIEVIEGREVTSLNLKARLAPYASQTVQSVTVRPIPEREDTLRLRVLANRITGERDIWMRGNRNFIGVLRKQMLIWRSLELSERLQYTTRSSSAQ